MPMMKAQLMMMRRTVNEHPLVQAELRFFFF